MKGHTRATRRKTSRERRRRASGNAISLAAGGAVIVGSAFNLKLRHSLGGRRASRGQYAVFENEFRRASDSALIAAECIAALEIRGHGGERRMPCRFLELDGDHYRAVLQLVDHLYRTGLAERPMAPRHVVRSCLFGDEGMSSLVSADELEVARRVVEIFLQGDEDFANRLWDLLYSRDDTRCFDRIGGREDEKQQRRYDRCGA